jgi:hypothetical protein
MCSVIDCSPGGPYTSSGTLRPVVQLSVNYKLAIRRCQKRSFCESALCDGRRSPHHAPENMQTSPIAINEGTRVFLCFRYPFTSAMAPTRAINKANVR